MRKNIKKLVNDTDRSKYRRKLNVRSKIKGTSLVPRICVTKSNRNLFIQAINDEDSKTLFTVQSFGKKSKYKNLSGETAKLMACDFANMAKEKDLLEYKFDRSGNKYSGLIKVFADSLRENGLKL